MHLSWYGLGCFKIQTTGATILTDPTLAGSGLRGPRIAATLVIYGDAAAAANVERGAASLVVRGPGEYEAGGVFVAGVAVPPGSGHTCYRLTAEGITMAICGTLPRLPSNDEVQTLAGSDVLLLPVGGGPVLKAPAAAQLVSWLEPRVVIPCYYRMPGLTLKLDPLDKFCREIGTCPTEEIAKLKLTRRDLPTEGLRVVIFSRT